MLLKHNLFKILNVYEMLNYSNLITFLCNPWLQDVKMTIKSSLKFYKLQTIFKLQNNNPKLNDLSVLKKQIFLFCFPITLKFFFLSF